LYYNFGSTDEIRLSDFFYHFIFHLLTIKEDFIMARVIGEDCISCGSCAAQCPVDAIAQGDAHYEINADVCIDCGACEAQCPVGAISEA